MSKFYDDVKQGLSSNPKRLYSKYFYDKVGDAIFQQLMHSPEYYLSECELEILQQQSADIADQVTDHFNEFDLIELGAGDASKSVFLLQGLLDKGSDFTYYPVDISQNVIEQLEDKLPKILPSIQIKGLNGEYLTMLKQLTEQSSKPKLILFLGANIGNMNMDHATTLCQKVQELLKPGDLFFIGFDLKKNPLTILAAYNDKAGLTRDFNLNLLSRINKKLAGNFDLDAFYHYPNYDPMTGACKSYLISAKDQEVSFSDGKDEVSIHFKQHEAIFMEISRKYSIEEIEDLAKAAGFEITNHFLDSKKWFVDSLWRKN
ncbi:L-histidine N(alpha)-methyltransferase [Albibacterium bauzanense]|uniref:Dimethylhistidine N-methyltransferase n=1 Tax=Albibacterium bauzanense TaxID=653929 RepID=A0A4R1M0M9_9SPHI|nr:L-histidine N(alpha)-methyltransferase [Albibacterium bauzanense]TCK85458.1 dimethylhistidine N-methyltransferase [Albibacterium bauzanense]